MPLWAKILLGLVVFMGVGFVLFRLMIPQLSPMPENLGVTAEGRLADCPDSPNCVSTSATTAEHSITPLTYSEDTAVAQARLVRLIKEMPGATIQTNNPGYIHAVFATPIMGYLDDAEFYFDEATSEIQLRSAARLGQSDMGVNRERMESIRAAFGN